MAFQPFQWHRIRNVANIVLLGSSIQVHSPAVHPPFPRSRACPVISIFSTQPHHACCRFILPIGCGCFTIFTVGSAPPREILSRCATTSIRPSGNRMRGAGDRRDETKRSGREGRGMVNGRRKKCGCSGGSDDGGTG